MYLHMAQKMHPDVALHLADATKKLAEIK